MGRGGSRKGVILLAFSSRDCNYRIFSGAIRTKLAKFYFRLWYENVVSGVERSRI